MDLTYYLMLMSKRMASDLFLSAGAPPNIKIGDPRDPTTVLGPLIREQQRARVEGYVASGLEQGATLVRRGGTLVLVGLPPTGTRVTFDPVAIADGALRILGSKMGSVRPQLDIPELVALYRQGRLKLDQLISGRYPLAQINEAVASADRGEALRPVITF